MRSKMIWLLLFITLFSVPTDVYAGSDRAYGDKFPAKVWDIPGMFFSYFTATETYFVPVTASSPLPVSVSGGISISSATINAVQPFITEAGVASSSKLDNQGSLNVNIASQTAPLSVTVVNADTPPFVDPDGVASAAQLTASGSLTVSVDNDMGPSGYASDPINVTVLDSAAPFVTNAGVASSAQLDASGSLNVNIASGSFTTTTEVTLSGPSGVATDPIYINATMPFVTTAGVASSAQLDASGSLNVNLASGGANLGVSVLSGSVTITNNMGPTGVATDPIVVNSAVTFAGVASSPQLDAAGRLNVNLASSGITLNAQVTNGFGPTGFATDPVTVGINNAIGPTAFATDPAYISSLATAPVYVRLTTDFVGSPTMYVTSLSTETPALISDLASWTTNSLIVMTVRGELYHGVATTTASSLHNYGLRMVSYDVLNISPYDTTYAESYISSSTTSQASVTCLVYPRPLR